MRIVNKSLAVGFRYCCFSIAKHEFMFQMRIYRMHKLSLHFEQIKRVKTKNGMEIV